MTTPGTIQCTSCGLLLTSFPSENLTGDEGTCGFRGRVRFRVYNKNKPDKYGMKLCVLCGAATGYVFKFEPYTGKSENNTIVALYDKLLSRYLDKNHTVYMDIFYTSPILPDFLWEKTIISMAAGGELC